MREGRSVLGFVVVLALLFGTGVSSGHASPFATFIEAQVSVPVASIFGAAVSPDGLFVFTTSQGSDAVRMFGREPVTGELTPLDAVRQGRDVDGLEGVRGVAVSPDGAHVYVAAKGAVVALGVDAVAGKLTPLAVYPQTVGGTLGLEGEVAVSPDGENVYVTSTYGDVVIVFDRDPATGLLTHLETHVQGVAGVDGVNGASAPVVTPDGAHLYLSGYGPNVTWFARDPSTGTLTFGGTTPVPGFLNVAPPKLALSPDSAFLYTSLGVVFARNVATGALTPVQSTDQLGPWIAMSPDGTQLYAALFQSQQLRHYARDPLTGELTLLASDDVALAALGPLVISPDGAHVYATVPTGIESFARDASTGALAPLGTLSGYVGTPPGLWGQKGAAFSSDGVSLYVVAGGRGSVPPEFGSLTVWSRDPSTGALTFEAIHEDGGGVEGIGQSWQVLLSPDDAYLYVTGSGAGRIGIFARDSLTGALTFVAVKREGEAGMSGLMNASVLMSPDGLYLYAMSPTSKTLTILQRDPATGDLVLVDQLALASVEVTSPSEITMSPDGAHLYVGVSFRTPPNLQYHMAAFARNAATGLVTFLGEVLRGNGAFSADGRYLYSGSELVRTTALPVVLRRDPDTGELTYVEDLPGTLLSGGGAGVGPIAVTSDGAYVFGFSGAGLSVFARNPISGRVDLLEVVEEGTGPVYGLQGGGVVLPSPDGRHAYAFATGGDSIVVFAIDDCGPTFSRVGAKANFKKIGGDADPQNDVMLFKATTVLREGTFDDLDPVGTGARVVGETAAGATAFDTTIPGGIFAGSGSAGWRSGIGKWIFVDRAGTSNGIKKIVLLDFRKKGPGLVKLKVQGRNGSYPFVAGDEPVGVRFEFGGSSRCARSGFGDEMCHFDGSGTALSCKP